MDVVKRGTPKDVLKTAVSALEGAAGTGADPFSIIVMDEPVAAWIVVNNTFTRIGNDSWNDGRYWSGVLFQLGDYMDVKSHQTMGVFSSITFENRKEGATVLKLERIKLQTDMYWINVVAKDSSTIFPDPMGVHHLCRLRLDPSSSIHEHFFPIWGGMTFWQNRDEGYGLTAKPGTDHHNRYDFTFNRTDKLQVEIYKNGVLQSAADLGLAGPLVGLIDTIRINGEEGIAHGDHLNPPQRPGSLRKI